MPEFDHKPVNLHLSETIRPPHFLNQHDAELCDRLLSFSGVDQPDISQIAILTASSPRLSSLVMERANSASLGLVHRVASVRQAVALLGARGVRRAIVDLMNSGIDNAGDRRVRIDDSHA